MNGKPHRAKFAREIHDEATGICLVIFPIQRRSWVWRCELINEPAQINRRALKRACVII
jgi:hypothetical protein